MAAHTSFNTISPNNEWDFFVDLTPNDSSVGSLNSEEDGPLYIPDQNAAWGATTVILELKLHLLIFL